MSDLYELRIVATRHGLTGPRQAAVIFHMRADSKQEAEENMQAILEFLGHKGIETLSGTLNPPRLV